MSLNNGFIQTRQKANTQQIKHTMLEKFINFKYFMQNKDSFY